MRLSRRPAGTSAGGQFAATTRARSGLRLDVDAAQSGREATAAAEHTRISRIYTDRLAAQDRETPGYQQRFTEMSQLITATNPGTLVCPPMNIEPDLDKLLTRMQSWDGSEVITRRGNVSACHSNTARLWESGDVAGIATGYALSEDGLWRQHTWGISASGEPVETTLLRSAYAGYVLTAGEAADFAAANR
jgi:hypothetical protein